MYFGMALLTMRRMTGRAAGDGQRRDGCFRLTDD